MPRGARSNYERTRSVPQHPDMAPAKRLRLLGRRATNVQTRPPLLIAAQTSRRAALRALHLMGKRKQRQRPRTPVLRKVKKTPVGTPPPDLPEETLLDAGDSSRPLLFPSGIGPGFSGRERERA